MFGTYDKNFSSNKTIIKALESQGVKVVQVNAHTSVTKIENAKDLGWIQIIKRILVKTKLLVVTITHVSSIIQSNALIVGYPGHIDVIFAKIICLLFRKKLVFFPLIIISTGFIDEYGILSANSPKAKFIKNVEKIIYKACDIILADTLYQKKHFIEIFGIQEEKVYLLPIGADNSTYVYKPKTSNQNNEINIVYYGLYSPVHGVKYIIEAAQFMKNNKNVFFIMVGDGTQFQENYQKANNYKLKNITFFKEMTESNALSTLQSADIFMGFFENHSAIYRAIPNKIYQGIALGKAVLTADAPVIRDVFTHKKNIYLCKPGNQESINSAILNLTRDKKLRNSIAKNAYNLYLENFTPEALGKVLLEIIKDL